MLTRRSTRRFSVLALPTPLSNAPAGPAGPHAGSSPRSCSTWPERSGGGPGAPDRKCSLPDCGHPAPPISTAQRLAQLKGEEPGRTHDESAGVAEARPGPVRLIAQRRHLGTADPLAEPLLGRRDAGLLVPTERRV